MVLEFFENGSVLIHDIKSGKQFNVNGRLLKPYLTLEPPTPKNKINLHILGALEDVILASPSPHQSS